MTNETKTGAELSQNESRNSTLKSQLKEQATPAGSENLATPLTDAEWLKEEEFSQLHYQWSQDKMGQDFYQMLMDKLTSKYGNPSRIADLERRLADRERQIQQLQHASRGIGMVSKREVARVCFVKYKGVWIFCHPSQDAMERLGITPSLAESEQSEPTPDMVKEGE
jgi:hypothetical protein